MRVYTRSGDKGSTSLVHGKRVPKSDIRVEAYGTCDEANSMIGLAVSYMKEEPFYIEEKLNESFHQIQTVLFHVGAELATPADKEVYWQIKEDHIKKLEKIIDEMDQSLEPLKQFILPGGKPAGAALHVARTVTRRAERLATRLEGEVNPLVLAYLNRLSDFLFVAARFVNAKSGETEQVLHQETNKNEAEAKDSSN